MWFGHKKQVQLLGLIVHINLPINPCSRPLNSTVISTCLWNISREHLQTRWYILISPSSRLWQRHETPRSSQPSSQLAPSQMPWRTSFTTVRIITTDTTGRVHWSRMTLCRDIRTLTVQHPNIPKQHEGRDPGWRGDLKLTLKKTWTNVKWNSKPNYRAGNFHC